MLTDDSLRVLYIKNFRKLSKYASTKTFYLHVVQAPKIPLTIEMEKLRLTKTAKLTMPEYTHPFPQSRNTPP